MGLNLNNETIPAVGMISLVAGILLNQLPGIEVWGFSVSAFAEGVLMGIALVMNVYYLATSSRKLSGGK